MWFVSKKKYNTLLADFESLKNLLQMPEVERLEYYNNNLTANFKPVEALQAWAKIFTSAFIEMNAPNYIEMTLGSGEDKYVCTVRKYSGKTPDQCRKEVESKLAEVLKQLEEK